MLRLVAFLLAILAVASGLAWLADRPGTLLINWEGYEVETSVFRASVIFAFATAAAVLLWGLARSIWSSPAAVGQFLTRRRQRRGLDALSSGMIAIGAGDRAMATRYAIQARKALPNEPLTHLLRAQAAQLSGDKSTSRRIFEAMLGSPDTEQLGLRGLYLEASREGATEAQRQFCERAMRLNPKLAWPVEALFDLQCKAADWAGALETLTSAKRHGNMEKSVAERRRAVLLTAQAQALEESQPDKAQSLALEAHAAAPDLIPAAAIAGRLLVSRGNTAKAAKVIQKTWAKAPHPDLAAAYAYARIGDSPRDRLTRIKQLAAINPHSDESPIAVANSAIEARAWDEARHALSPLLVDGRLTRRVATLMARIEGEQHGDKGRVREWLARAVNAPRDPAWTADGVVADNWAPVSPVTGAFDVFQWRVPVEDLGHGDSEALSDRLEALVTLGESGGATHPGSTDVVPVATASPERRDSGAVDAEVVETPSESTAAAKAAVTIDAGRAPVAAPASSATVAPAEVEAEAGKSGPRSARPVKSSASSAAMPEPPTPIARSKARARSDEHPRMTADYVPPRAPDDPGTELEDDGQDLSRAKPYRATS